jgi:hypothetical protein
MFWFDQLATYLWLARSDIPLCYRSRYFHLKSDGTPQAQTIFCAPSIKASIVEVSANLNNGSLYSVVALSDSLTAAYPGLISQPYNGSVALQMYFTRFLSIVYPTRVIFPSNNNTFIQARATTVRSGVPSAIFRFAAQMTNGLQSTFDLPNGFLDITKTVYVCGVRCSPCTSISNSVSF